MGRLFNAAAINSDDISAKALGDAGRLTSRERLWRALRHQEPNCVPLDCSANRGIDERWRAYFGLDPAGGDGLLRALGVDSRLVGVAYKGNAGILSRRNAA